MPKDAKKQDKPKPKDEPKIEPPKGKGKELLDALRVVTDPEIGISIVDLGLIYGIDWSDKKCDIRLTLTSQACPVGPQIVQSVQKVAQGHTELPADKVKVELVWRPVWDPRQHATEDGKFMLGLY